MIHLLQKAMKKSIEECKVAGVSVLVVKDGEEVCFVSEGLADRDAGKEIKRDTIFRLYSQTKPVCAVAAMILVERGELDLYQPVSDFLPGFKNQVVWENGQNRPVKREMHVHDLLGMTSGLYYPDENHATGLQTTRIFEELDERLLGDNAMTTQELANALGKCTLAFDPGSYWHYGTSADVLGAVIEVVTGMKLGEFMEKEIFEPLGMKDTGFWVPEEKQHRLAKVYETVKNENGAELVLYTGNNLGIQNAMHRPPAYEAGGAGLASTLDDYLRFAQMLLNGGELDGVRILKEETVKYMTNAQLLDCQQSGYEERFGLMGYSYGNLMRICKNPGQAKALAREGEYGWDGWLGVYFANFPKENMTILMGMQKKDSGTWELTRKLRNIILSSIS